ncbi:hypothetical protein GGR74_003339 [Xanthomonas arboricola]|nr:hypothetical protein [Xanthomonas euroxanthea]
MRQELVHEASAGGVERGSTLGDSLPAIAR